VSGESGRLRRAVDRLMDAQQEAIEVTGRALDVEGWDEQPEANQRLEAALVDVRDILEGAMEDARDILEGEP
jgi:Na+/phosphate symporter